MGNQSEFYFRNETGNVEIQLVGFRMMDEDDSIFELRSHGFSNKLRKGGIKGIEFFKVKSGLIRDVETIRIYFKGFSTTQQYNIIKLMNDELIKNIFSPIKKFKDEYGTIYWSQEIPYVKKLITEIEASVILSDLSGIKSLKEITSESKKLNSNSGSKNSKSSIDLYLELDKSGKALQCKTYNSTECYKTILYEDYDKKLLLHYFRHRLYFRNYSNDQIDVVIQFLSRQRNVSYTKEIDEKGNSYYSLEKNFEYEKELPKKGSNEKPMSNVEFFDRDELGDPDLLDSWEDAYRKQEWIEPEDPYKEIELRSDKELDDDKIDPRVI